MSKDEIIRFEILIAAQKLFKQFGLKKTTMDDIARGCGKAKSSLYHYFKSKDEVFDAVIDYELVEVRRMVTSDIQNASDLCEAINTYMISFYKNLINKVNIYRIVKQEVLVGNNLLDYFKKIVDYEEKFIEKIINDAIKNGAKFDFDEDTKEVLIEMLVVGFMGIVRYSIELDQDINFEKLERTTNILVKKIFG